MQQAIRGKSLEVTAIGFGSGGERAGAEAHVFDGKGNGLKQDSFAGRIVRRCSRHGERRSGSKRCGASGGSGSDKLATTDFCQESTSITRGHHHANNTSIHRRIPRAAPNLECTGLVRGLSTGSAFALA